MSETLIGNVRGLQGAQGPQGIQGVQGPAGATGPQGPAGPSGADVTGMSVTYNTQSEQGNVYDVSFTDSASQTHSAGSIVCPFGPQGATGATGPQGPAGQNGSDGDDGISPTVTVRTITGGHQIEIVSAGGTERFDVMDGVDGAVQVNETPVNFNVDSISASINAIPDNTVGTLNFVDANGDAKKATIYYDTLITRMYGYGGSLLKYSAWSPSACKYLKANGCLFITSGYSTYPVMLYAGKLCVMRYNIITNKETELVGSVSAFGLDDSAKLTARPSCIFAYNVSGYGTEEYSEIEIIPYPNHDYLMDVTNLLKLDMSNASESVNTFNITDMQALGHYGHYRARIYAVEGGGASTIVDYADVTISTALGSGNMEVTVKVKPLNVKHQVDFSTKQWYMDAPIRINAGLISYQ